MTARADAGRRRVAALLLAVTTAGTAGCTTQQSAIAPSTVVPSARPSVPQTGPGTYVGEAVNAVGAPVPVRVVIGGAPNAQEASEDTAVRAFLRSAYATLGLPPVSPTFLSVAIDNTGQVDPVPLPDDVDVLDPKGRGANFRPVYDVVRETTELLTPDTALRRRGAVLGQRLAVRDNLVRPGKVEIVRYVSTDPLTGVAGVVLNGALARKQAR